MKDHTNKTRPLLFHEMFMEAMSALQHAAAPEAMTDNKKKKMARKYERTTVTRALEYERLFTHLATKLLTPRLEEYKAKTSADEQKKTIAECDDCIRDNEDSCARIKKAVSAAERFASKAERKAAALEARARGAAGRADKHEALAHAAIAKTATLEEAAAKPSRTWVECVRNIPRHVRALALERLRGACRSETKACNLSAFKMSQAAAARKKAAAATTAAELARTIVTAEKEMALDKCAELERENDAVRAFSAEAAKTAPKDIPDLIARHPAQLFVLKAGPDGVGNSTVALAVPGKSRVADLKAIYEEKEGVPVCKQRFIFGGKELEDDVPLVNYGIRAGSTLQFAMRLPGGMAPTPGAAGSSSGAGSSNDPDDDDREALLRAREDKKRHKIMSAEALMATTLLSDVGRQQYRETLKGQWAEAREFAVAAPNLQSVKAVLERLRNNLLACDELRDRDTGELKRALLMRACPVSALARNPETGEPDAEEAAKCILPALQACYDYVMTMTGSEGVVAAGRSHNPFDLAVQAPEHPPTPGQPLRSGYNPFKDSITDAFDERGELYPWAAQQVALPGGGSEPRIADAARVLPCGDITAPPIFFWGRARESKSQLIIGMIGLLLRIPNVKICCSVAPNKDAVLRELKDKVDMAGWEAMGMGKVATTADYKEGSSVQIDDATIDKWAREADVFLYSHDVVNDVKAFDTLIKRWSNEGYAVISIHDEADTLIKAMRESDEDDPEKDNILQIIRESYSLKYTRTILVGATLAATLNEPSLWGSLLMGNAASRHVRVQAKELLMTIPPVEPARQYMEYIGLDKTYDRGYDRQGAGSDRNAFTWSNIEQTLLDNRPSFLAAMREKAARRLRAVEALVGENGLVTPVRKRVRRGQALGDMETQDEATARYQRLLTKANSDVAAAQALREDDPIPNLMIRDLHNDDGTAPYLPPGLCNFYIEELKTAMILQRTRTFMATEPRVVAIPRIGEKENHTVNQTLVVAPTNKQKATDHDPEGGCLGYAKAAVDMAIEMQQPLAVMLYTRTGPGKVKELTGFDCAKGKWGAVKLFLVLPKTETVYLEGYDPDDDNLLTGENPRRVTTTVWRQLEVAGYDSAKEAIGAAREAMDAHGMLDQFDRLRVIYTGYEMFKAAVTLSVSNYEMPKADPANPREKVRRVHFLPKSMIYCHQPNKQFGVLYQTIARTFNALLAFQMPASWEGIDILTHKHTLLQVKAYYRIEEKLASLMRGDHGESSRIPQNLMNGLASCVQSVAAALGEQVNAQFLKRALGLRRLSVQDSVRRGDPNQGAVYEEPGEYDDLGQEDEVVDLTADGATSDGASSGDADVFVDIMMMVRTLHVEPGPDGQAWARAGLVGPAHVRKISARNAVQNVLRQLTVSEQTALLCPQVQLPNGRVTKQAAAWTTTKILEQWPDLTARVLPTFWTLVWKLVDARNAQDKNSLAWIRKAKAEAYRVHTTLLGAFRYLLLTGQFRPQGTDMWVQVGRLAKELGDFAGASADHAARCAMREKMLKNAFRGLAFHKGPDVDDHRDCVSVMCLLLDRVDLDLGVPLTGAPWYLPTYRASLQYDPAIKRPTDASDVSDVDLQNLLAEVEENSLFKGPMGIETESILVPGRGRRKKAAPGADDDDGRVTYFECLTPEMKQKVMDRWPSEITATTLQAFLDQMQSGIDNGMNPGDAPIPACKDTVAKKHERAMMRGLYVCLDIHERAVAAGSNQFTNFTIPDDATVIQLMRTLYDKMGDAGEFSQFCYQYPTREKPYALQGKLKPDGSRNPSAVIDWRQAFRRWLAVFAPPQ